MKDLRQYETDDPGERSVTVALMELFAAIARSGVTEDPLAVVCRCLVNGIPEVQFTFYCYADEETGHIAAVKNGVKLMIPTPDVERKIVAQMRRMTAAEDVAVIDPKLSLSLLSAKDRRRWKCHRSLAVRIADGDDPQAAVLSVHLPDDFEVKPRHLAWMALLASAASAHLSRHREFAKARNVLVEAIGVKNKLSLALDAMRKRVREYLADLVKVKGDYEAGNLTLLEVLRLVEKSGQSLYALADVADRTSPDEDPKFRDSGFGVWMAKVLHDPRMKAIVGIRGSNKTGLLHAVRRTLLSGGVPESHIVIIDFEDARFRRFKTAKDVIAYLKSFPESNEMRYLFLDEVGMVNWHSDLLAQLQREKGWNVWLAASSAHILQFGKKDESKHVLTYRLWTDPRSPRSRFELERYWCQIFMRDVVSGVDHPDIRAKETLAEYYSDHLGEGKSLKDISVALSAFGRRLSPTTVGSYRQSLVDAYLIDVSEIYDVAAGAVVKSASGRVFYTDLELRNWRYGQAPEDDAARQELNRFYLELRRKHGKVYTPLDRESDFVTLDANGEVRYWNLPPGGY